MRVMCIKSTWKRVREGAKCNGRPSFGEVYNVKNVLEWGGDHYYELFELENGGFEVSAFAPLSDTDPMEEKETEQEQIQKVLKDG